MRDLKPENIIIDSNNDAILIDFDSSNEETNSNDICDLSFTAPEQCNSNEYTYKVDSYSVGMIIHFFFN